MSTHPDCCEAKLLQSEYAEAQWVFENADKSLAMKSNENDPVYIAAWLNRQKAHKLLLAAMKAYRQHLEKHKCQSGLFTDVA